MLELSKADENQRGSLSFSVGSKAKTTFGIATRKKLVT